MGGRSCSTRLAVVRRPVLLGGILNVRNAILLGTFVFIKKSLQQSSIPAGKIAQRGLRAAVQSGFSGGAMKILLPVDDSKFSEAATQAVITQHQRPGTEVKVMHVVDLGLRVPTRYAQELRTESVKEGEALVAKTAERLRAAGIKVVTDVEEGDPRARIIDNAVRWPADLIVLGSHGRTGLEYFRMGSVAESVARHSPCSVEIVRLGSAARLS